MHAHRIETTLCEEGTLVLSNLPFHAGEEVEVIVLPRARTVAQVSRYPLHGKPVQFSDPFEPVAQNDWDAAR